MVKGKRNGLTFTECSVKICRFLLFSPPYWKWSYHNATQSECAHRLVDHWGSLSILQYRKWIIDHDAKYWNVIKMVHLVSHLKPFQKIFGDRRQIEFTSLSLFHIQQGEKDAKTQSQQGKTSKVHSPSHSRIVVLGSLSFPWQSTSEHSNKRRTRQATLNGTVHHMLEFSHWQLIPWTVSPLWKSYYSYIKRNPCSFYYKGGNEGFDRTFA